MVYVVYCVASGKQEKVQACLVTFNMAIYYIMPQFIQNHYRFIMLMKTCMIS